MIKSKYFSESEFKRCTPACSLQDMKQEFMTRMDRVRERAGIPLVINSAYRSVAYEKTKGRAGTSAHTLGLALDIRCTSDRNRSLIIKALILEGFTRIGVSKTFIHADTSQGHTQQVTWLY